ATLVFSSRLIRPTRPPAVAAPARRSDAAASLSATCGTASARLTGALTMSQPSARRCSASAPRSEKCRSTNGPTRRGRSAQYRAIASSTTRRADAASSRGSPTRAGASPLAVGLLEDRDGADPGGAGRLELHREARHGEAEGRQRLEIVQLLDLEIADLAA